MLIINIKSYKQSECIIKNTILVGRFNINKIDLWRDLFKNIVKYLRKSIQGSGLLTNKSNPIIELQRYEINI